MAAGNVWTSAGQAEVVDQYDTNATTDFIGWGVGTTTPAITDTDLETASTEARATTSGARTQPSANVIQWVGTITADGSKNISEAGVFYAVGTGSPPTLGTPLICHSVFTAIPVVLNDTIQFTFTLTFATG